MPNHIKLTNRSLFYYSYLYIDTNTFLADSFFIQNKIKVRFLYDMAKDNCPYTLVFCKIKKSDENVFLKSLEMLENKMLLLGYTDYPTFCTSTLNAIEAQAI